MATQVYNLMVYAFALCRFAGQRPVGWRNGSMGRQQAWTRKEETRGRQRLSLILRLVFSLCRSDGWTWRLARIADCLRLILRFVFVWMQATRWMAAWACRLEDLMRLALFISVVCVQVEGRRLRHRWQDWSLNNRAKDEAWNNSSMAWGRCWTDREDGTMGWGADWGRWAEDEWRTARAKMRWMGIQMQNLDEDRLKGIDSNWTWCTQTH